MKFNTRIISILFAFLVCFGLFGNCAPAPFTSDGNGQPYEGETPFRTGDIGFGDELEEPEAPGDPVDSNNQMLGHGLAMEGFGMQSQDSSNLVNIPLVETDSFTNAFLGDAALSSKTKYALADYDINNKKEKPSQSAKGEKEISYYMEDNAFSQGAEFVEDNAFDTDLQEEEALISEQSTLRTERETLIAEEESDDEGSAGEAERGGENRESAEDSPQVAAETIESIHGLEEVIYSCVPDSPGFVDKLEFGLIAGETGMKLQTLSGNSHSNVWETSQPGQFINRAFDSGEIITEITLLHPLVIVAYSDAMGSFSQQLILCDGPKVAEFRKDTDTKNLLTTDRTSNRQPSSIFE